MVNKFDWKILVVKTIKNVAIVGIPLLLPIVLNLIGEWQNVTLGVALSSIAYAIKNYFANK